MRTDQRKKRKTRKTTKTQGKQPAYRPKKRRRTANKRPPARQRQKKRRRKKRGFAKTLLTVIAILLLLGISGFALWYFSFEKLNLEDYVSVSYTGYDTEGTAALSLLETEKNIPFLKDVEIRLLSENGSLQNGDSLDIHFIYDNASAKEQKLRIESDQCQIEVTGLPEGKELSTEDLFRDVRIVYEGTAPELSVTLVNDSADPFLKTIAYEITDGKTYYDIGDSFIVKASFSRECAVENEYIVASSENACTKEYCVEGADRYIREVSELSPELIQTLDETASSLFGDATEYGLRIFSEANLMPIWVNGKTTFVWSSPRLISAYLNVLKPEYFGTVKSHNNDVKLVYTATLSQADGVACKAEVVVQFNNILKKSDGTYDLSLDSGRIIAASFKNSHIRDLVNDTYNEEYQSQKLDL